MKDKILLVAIILLALALRVPWLDKFPAGLNADEAAIGYNDYSLLATGLDEHGAPWPLAFRSFDDYKPGGYFYLVLPFVATLGLNIWAVRLPSALLGVLSVYFVYLLVNKLFPKHSSAKSRITFGIGHLAALLLAISPWHIHYSRGGWEANVASVFMIIGLYFLVRTFEKTKYFLFSVLSFVFSLYTYHSLRIVVPLVFICFLAIYFEEIKKLFKDTQKTRQIIISAVIGILSLLPLLLQFTSAEGRSRFSGVSVFADTGPLWEALELRRADNSDLRAKFLHNRYVTYSYRFAKNYLSHFSPRFLFITGDEIARNKVPGMGQLYLWAAPFLLLGICFLIGKNDQSSKLILAWLFISPIAAALTFQSPHALRSQNMVYPLIIITAVGLYQSAVFLKKKLKLFFIGFLLLATFLGGYELARYLHEYYVHYPKELAYAWQYGFDQVSDYANKRLDQYDHVIISDRYDQPYILIAFFQKLSPAIMQKTPLTPRDQFGFSTVRDLGKYQFHRIDWGVDSQSPNTLIIAADEGAPDDQAIDKILDPAGKTMYRIFDTNKLK